LGQVQNRFSSKAQRRQYKTKIAKEEGRAVSRGAEGSKKIPQKSHGNLDRSVVKRLVKLGRPKRQIRRKEEN